MAIPTPIVVVGAALASSLITYSLTHESTGVEEPNRAPEVSGSSSEISNVGSSPEVSSISHEGCTPRASRTSDVDDSPDKAKSPGARGPEGETPAKAEDIDEAIANRMKRQQKIKEDMRAFISSEREKGNENISAVVENRFYQEEVDEEWASDKESDLSDRFESDEELRGVHPLEITCRSENCKVVLPIESQKNISSISSRLTEKAVDGEGKESTVYSFPDNATNRLVVYVSKKDGMGLIQ